MKTKRVAIYDPYLDVLGGGEQYLLTALHALEEEGYESTIFWHENISEQIKGKFDLTFKNLNFDTITFQKSISPLKRYSTLASYDVLFYITDGSYFFSGAKKNFVYAMVPYHNLYKPPGLNKLKLRSWRFIANSRFTASWLKKWGVKPTVHYPMITVPNSNKTTKQKLILVVGRFFGQLHTKKHQEAIDSFNTLQKLGGFKDFKLAIAGGLKKEDEAYFKSLQDLASTNNSIALYPDISYSNLQKLYQDAMFFWHFTGYGEDEMVHPERVEHLGITPLEAMSYGEVVYAYQAGGPKELIQHGINGMLFTTKGELIKSMQDLIKSKSKIETISNNASQYVKENFSYDVFKKNLLSIIEG